MFQKIKEEIKTNKNFIYLSIIISVLTILPQLYMAHTLKHFLAIILLSILLILFSLFSKLIFSVTTIYLNIINSIQYNIFVHWGSEVSLYNRFEVSVRAPAYEVFEYLNNFVDYRDYFLISYSTIIFIVLYQFTIKSTNNYNIVKKLSILPAMLIFSLLMEKEPFSVLNTYIATYNNFHNNVILSQRNIYLTNLPKKNNDIKNNKLYDKIIIIQGESVNKKYLNIYGYDKKTTPFLTSQLASKKLYLFNAISPSNQTRYCIPMLFTEANVTNWQENFIHSKSIISDFKNYGYETNWISNQGKFGKADSYITNIARESDNIVFFNQGSYHKSKSDLVIEKYLQEREINNNYEVYIFHLMGSHFSYKKRYTEKYLFYKHPENLTQEYINTIYFTDNIIKSITQHFDKVGLRTLVIYISDHGEHIGQNIHGHGFLPSYKDEFQIPFTIYSTIVNKRIDEIYKDNKKHYFNLQNFSHLIKYITGIENKKDISYSSKIFSIDPKNKLNYDSL